jgi:ferredoxin-NADP reductase
MAAEEIFLSFAKKEKIAKDTYSFYFFKKEFSYLPGQYIRMVLPHESPDDRGTSRFFTISSSPHEKDYVIITVKIIQSSFKNALIELKPGARVKIFGPLGNFILHDDEQEPLVFLSGGMGVTPFRSMLSYAAAKNMKLPLVLLASFSNHEEKIFHDELMMINREHKNMEVIYSNTRISEDLLRKYIPDLSQPKYYLVGPPAMVEATRELLESLNIDEEKILTESFTGY